jgi:hypothetical protein
MTNFEKRLRDDLEPVLAMPDPRVKISAYHDMPYAIFRYDPEQEFALRASVGRLTTRLQNRGKRITIISLAECLHAAMTAERPLADWYAAEQAIGVEETVQTITNLLEDYQPLVDLVAQRMPATAEPTTDLVFITRTGALFPVYRTFSLLEQLKGRVVVPTILFYPGDLDGAAGLRFMGVLDAEHNYRPKIF